MDASDRPGRLAVARLPSIAVLAGTLVFAIDRLWNAVWEHGAMRWRWIHELTVWAGHVTLALAIAALALLASASAVVLPLRLRPHWIGTLALPSLTLAVVLAVPLYGIGTELAAGAWISEQWFAPWVVWTPTLAVLVAAPPWLALLHAARPRRELWRLVLLGLIVLALAAVVFADHEVMPGLHPGFHRLLGAATSAGSIALVVRVRQDRSMARHEPVVALGLAVCALALWFASTTPTRGALSLRSSFARLWMASTLPSARTTVLRDLLAELDVRSYGQPTVSPPADFAGRGEWNIVVVVVDTMRADTVPPVRPRDGLSFARPGDTPRIDAWLQGTYRFTHAYTPATATKRAMPAMLRSIEASEDPFVGVSIGERMAGLGMLPLAVVHEYFEPARHDQITALLDGFARVHAYDKTNARSAVSDALQLAASAGSQRFMMMLHLYTLHRPGFDGRVVPRGVPRRTAYRRSLKYLDQQFAALLDGLDQLGLRERTLVVLTSDHGEGLGDHEAILHGPSVFDEDVRVPLAFAIPGHTGHPIDETVGTIDLVPTLLDLVGEQPIADARGRSLVPLFVGERDQPERPYYFANWDDTRVGLVRGREKVVFERELGLSMRFDLADDPDEHVDLHDVASTGPELLRRLIELEPALAAAELADDETQALLRMRLDEIDPRAPTPALDLLVRLVAIEPRPELLVRCAELFEQGGTDVRALLAQHLLAPVPGAMLEPMTAWLGTLQGEPAELAVVEALARHHVPSFAPELVARRMGAFAEHGDASSWAPWLRLVRFWPKPEPLFAEPLSRMVQRAR
ncbi:MAG: sulfatase-like hydrolase/transferase, partial [Deltaproteobacteria bacterium]|nr:sulfatase-like hydrolase/transferase [Nannocystaceae bacterium]